MFFVIIHNVRSILNVGSIFRTADGAGVDMVYLTGYTPGPDTHADKISKTALGAEVSVPWERVKRVGDLMRRLRADGVTVIALEQAKTSVDYRRYKSRGSIALIIGNEVKGIGRLLRSNRRINVGLQHVVSQSDFQIVQHKTNVAQSGIDDIIEIPMRGRKESLNVAVAFGIAAYELTRRIRT